MITTPPAPPLDPITVVIADDHALFRRSLARAIRADGRFALVGIAADGREALGLIASLDPDVAVLDQRMPELTGVEVCAQLRLRPEGPSTGVLLLSAFEDEPLVASAVGSGAAGYLGKGTPVPDVLTAIERVGRGGVAYTRTTVAGLNRAVRGEG